MPTVQTVVRRMNKYHPKTAREFRKMCKIPLKLVGSGSYREAYRVGDLPIVVKFLLDCDDCSSIEHARIEYKMYKRILQSKRKYRLIKQFMPKIHLFDSKTGVSVMKTYRLVKYEKDSKHNELDYLVQRATGKEYCDVNNSGNLGKDEKGRLKFLDLGCFAKNKYSEF